MSTIPPVHFNEYNSLINALSAYQGGAAKGPKKTGTPHTAIPFGQLTAGGNVNIVSADAKDLYQRGLAPAVGLKEVSAGMYKGKQNILTEVAIA